jgi:hypothetical protein
MLRSAIDTVNLELFLPMLSPVDQEKHKSKIPSLNCDQPEFFWIFRNIDFKQWDTSSSSQVLWLSGPPKCSIHQVASYIVDQKNGGLEKQNIVLYFFCSTAITENRIVVVFVHTLLCQLVSGSQINKKTSIIREFLHGLLGEFLKHNGASKWKRRGFKEEDSLDGKIKKILDAPASELLAALGTVLGGGQQQQLLVVIDGLDKAGHQKDELIRGGRAFIEHLQKSTSHVKALLTSLPQTEIKELLNGLPCIEYDKERKGLASTLCFNSKSNLL